MDHLYMSAVYPLLRKQYKQCLHMVLLIIHRYAQRFDQDEDDFVSWASSVFTVISAKLSEHQTY